MRKHSDVPEVKRSRLGRLLFAIAVSSLSCAPGSPPNETAIKEDLLGREAAFPGGTWLFGSLSQFQSVEILEKNAEGNIVEMKLALELARNEELFRARGSVTYVQNGSAWDFRAVTLDDLFSVNGKAQLETVKTLRNLGTAFLSYLSDHDAETLGEPLAGPLSFEDVRRRLRPESDDFFYMYEVPEIDGWGNTLELWLKPSEWPKYDLLVRSPGSDGRFSSGVLYGAGEFSPSNHEGDIVWADGFFLDWPGGGR